MSHHIDPFDLSGRVAMVTGAGQGVGRAIALTLAAHGAQVVVNDFHGDRADAVVAEIERAGGNAIPLVADVGDLAAVRSGIETIATALGPISILVNNAGNGGPDGFPSELPLFWESDPARWHRFLHVNLLGVMNCCHAVLPGMVAQKWGRVVTIVSDAARTLESRMADYAAAKAGAAGFMRGLAADAARFGVTANSIAIGTMAPNPVESPDAPRTAKQLARYAIRRVGTPDDVTGTVLLLSSDASSWITGQTYAVNGGFSAGL